MLVNECLGEDGDCGGRGGGLRLYADPAGAGDVETKAALSSPPPPQSTNKHNHRRGITPFRKKRPLASVTRVGAGPSFGNTERERGREILRKHY